MYKFNILIHKLNIFFIKDDIVESQFVTVFGLQNDSDGTQSHLWKRDS